MAEMVPSWATSSDPLIFLALLFDVLTAASAACSVDRGHETKPAAWATPVMS
jgi:hypothetical protein